MCHLGHPVRRDPATSQPRVLYGSGDSGDISGVGLSRLSRYRYATLLICADQGDFADVAGHKNVTGEKWR